MPIYESSKDYGTGVVLILWAGDKPSDEEFLDHARTEYGTDGSLEIDYPTGFRGMTNYGTATVTPNAKLTVGEPVSRGTDWAPKQYASYTVNLRGNYETLHRRVLRPPH